MLEILFYIWLTGAISVTGHGIYKCKSKPLRPISNGECYAMSAAKGIIWPVAVGNYVVRKCKGE